MPPKRPRSEDGDNSQDEDEIDQVISSDVEETVAAPAEASDAAKPSDSSIPEKKRRGRPPGSKNKKAKANHDGPAAGEAGPSVPAPPKRPRGRPRKPRTEAELEAERQKALLPKRPRGRPPKKPKTDAAGSSTAAEASTSTAAEKKPRGRPKKTA